MKLSVLKDELVLIFLVDLEILYGLYDSTNAFHFPCINLQNHHSPSHHSVKLILRGIISLKHFTACLLLSQITFPLTESECRKLRDFESKMLQYPTHRLASVCVRAADTVPLAGENENR